MATRASRAIVASALRALAAFGGMAMLAEPLARGDDEPARPVRVTYDAPAECPSMSAFVRDLRARSPHIVVTRESPAFGLAVRVRREGRRVVGQVEVSAANGTTSQREVEGESCPDVVAALAFIASIASVVSVTPSESASAPPTAPAAATPPAASVELTPAGPKPLASPSTTVAPIVDTPLVPIAPPPSAAARLRIALGGHVGVAYGLAPIVVVPLYLFVDAARPTEGAFAPSVRLRAGHAESGDVTAASGTAAFASTTLGVDGCAGVALGARRSVEIAGCVRLEGGVLYARGRDVTPVRSALRPWVALGPALRVSVTVAGPVFVELEAGAPIPFVRDRFFFASSTTLFRTSAVGVAGALGVGVAFR